MTITDKEPLIVTRSGVRGWREVDPTHEEQVSYARLEEDNPNADEKDVSVGVAAALQLAIQKGFPVLIFF